MTTDNARHNAEVRAARGRQLAALRERLDVFERELAELVNKHSIEEVAGHIPDFIIAKHLVQALIALGLTIRTTQAWYDAHPEPGPASELIVPDQRIIVPEVHHVAGD